MKKYLYIFKATLMENLQYVMNILLGFISFFVLLYIFLNLWNYIYSDSTSLIDGYSKTQMIWYVVVTEIMWFGTRNQTLTRQISNDIKSGTIAYNINKPYNYMFYIIARHLGEITIKFFLFLGVGILFGYLFIGSLPNFSIGTIPILIPVFFLSILINSFIRIGISLISFWIEDAGPFHWIYDKLIIVIGTLFPVEVFPMWLQPFIKCSPIYVITYGPAKLVINFSYQMFLKVLFAQGLYIIITISLLMLLYQRGAKKLNVNGG
jgi:ABC-2 type transport system permease protein